MCIHDGRGKFVFILSFLAPELLVAHIGGRTRWFCVKTLLLAKNRNQLPVELFFIISPYLNTMQEIVFNPPWKKYLTNQRFRGPDCAWALINAFATAGVWILVYSGIARPIFVDLITEYELPAEFEEGEAGAEWADGPPIPQGKCWIWTGLWYPHINMLL